ncbi:hypothetical protein [Actinoplanes sp. NPDC089786]|uniref:hypothetical protein n=1 Tax=Actinoplanes sp. NPDC089786 TaxID=3155185 RepID=UPI00343E859F
MLPTIDVHEVTIDATPEAIWPALLRTVRGAFSGPLPTAYARAIRSRPWQPSRDTLAGFRITESVEPAALTLEGQHLFSVYALSFHIAARPEGGSRLSAESRADFPGPHGALYRLAVISSGFHARSVRRLLATVSRRTSRPVPPARHPQRPAP